LFVSYPVGVVGLYRLMTSYVLSWAALACILLPCPTNAVADPGGSLSLDDPVPRSSNHCIKPPTIMLSWQILFCFLTDYVIVVTQNITSFRGTCPQTYYTGALPQNPNGGLPSQTLSWTSFPKS